MGQHGHAYRAKWRLRYQSGRLHPHFLSAPVCRGQRPVEVHGTRWRRSHGEEFRQRPTVLDITDPNRPVQLTPQVISMNGKYEIAVQVPFITTNPSTSVRHTLLAVADDRVASAAGVWANHPSKWHSAQAGADIAMV